MYSHVEGARGKTGNGPRGIQGMDHVAYNLCGMRREVLCEVWGLRLGCLLVLTLGVHACTCLVCRVWGVRCLVAGFLPSAMVKELLTKHKNNVELVVAELLSKQDQPPSKQTITAPARIAATAAVCVGGGGVGSKGVGSKTSVVDDEIEIECVMCMDAPKTHVFVPCGHMCVCSACAATIMGAKKECPQCRGAATHCMQVFG